jgi:predicted SprT family Zn-dependent metalloprotease
MTQTTKVYWVCQPCGEQIGKRKANNATWHNGTCDHCGQKFVSVTELRDFGGLAGA